jgi:hypothetical protein
MIATHLFIIRILVWAQSETTLGLPFASRAIVTPHKNQVSHHSDPIRALALPLIAPFIDQ